MKFAFDIGGTISKFPDECRSMMASMYSAGHWIYVLTDMHDREDVRRQLEANGVSRYIRLEKHILIADYDKHGEAAKAVLLRQYKIDVFFDDFPGYLVWPWPTPAPLRLQVMPDPRRPYWHPDWVCGGGDFGRRCFLESEPTPCDP